MTIEQLAPEKHLMPDHKCEDGEDHEWVDDRERYGDDADGNRGIWVHYKRCVKCGDQR